MDIKEEYEKCINSAYYFYTKYFYINNKPATTNLTEEEFNKRQDTYLKFAINKIRIRK
jgi:hypothetical protein